MNVTDFQTELTTALGGNLIDVELTAADFTFAFSKAKRTFQQYGNNNYDRKFFSLPVTAGTKVYTLLAEDNIDTIVRIIKPRGGLGTEDPFTMSVVHDIWYEVNKAHDTSLLTYELSQQMLENYNTMMANEAQFIWTKRNLKLTLLDPPTVTETWVLEAYGDLTDDEYRDLLWIQEFALAELKLILGRAYRKLGTVTTPAGEAALDGADLISDGKEEKEKLIQNIADYIDGDATGSVLIIG
jgi:hypothetical protein